MAVIKHQPYNTRLQLNEEQLAAAKQPGESHTSALETPSVTLGYNPYSLFAQQRAGSNFLRRGKRATTLSTPNTLRKQR